MIPPFSLEFIVKTIGLIHDSWEYFNPHFIESLKKRKGYD